MTMLAKSALVYAMPLAIAFGAGTTALPNHRLLRWTSGGFKGILAGEGLYAACSAANGPTFSIMRASLYKRHDRVIRQI